MKKSQFLIFLLTIISFFQSCSSGDPGNDTPEDLGKTILYALKQNDKELFQTLVYSENEVNYMIAHSEVYKANENEQKHLFNQFKENNLKF